MTTTGGGTLARAIVMSLGSLLSGALLIYALIPIVDKFRLMQTNGIFDTWDTSTNLGLNGPLLMAAIVGGSVFRPAASRAVRDVDGRVGEVLRVVPFGTLGAFLVSLAGPRMMTAPTTVGWLEDPTFGNREEWGTLSWVFYALPYALTVLLGIGVLIAIWHGLVEVRADRRRGSQTLHHDNTEGMTMGLFGKRDKQEGLRMAEDIGAGRGLQGKLMRGLMGAENADRIGAAAQAARAGETASMAMAAGVASISATVTAVVDTGQLVNFDPMVNLTAQLDDGRTVTLHTLVSKLQIPRVGDRIALIENPAQPGTLLYGGLAQV